MSVMINENGNWQQRDDGLWETARPLPFYFAFRKGCQCGKRFWKIDSYHTHFRQEHTDNKVYKRTPKGLIEVAPNQS